VGGLDLVEERSVASALSLSACLDKVERDSFAACEAYIPTEYTLIGPFFLTPTPNKSKPFNFGAKLIPVALSVMADPHVSTTRRSKHDAAIDEDTMVLLECYCICIVLYLYCIVLYLYYIVLYLCISLLLSE